MNFVKSAQSYGPLFVKKNCFRALSRSFFGRLSSYFAYELIFRRSGLDCRWINIVKIAERYCS